MNIGLSQRVLYHKGRAYDSTEHGWYSYLSDHTLTFIPNRTDQDFETLADWLDMFIITGGDDSTIRRLVETKLARMMMERQKPVLGICHGAFLLTALLGGVIGESITHMDTLHSVYYFGEERTVNSHHNQQIKVPHSSATVLVVDPEGYCESWIDGKLAGIVWHPERMRDPWIPDEIQDLFEQVK